MSAQYQYDQRYAAAAPNGYSPTYYDPKTGELMIINPDSGKGRPGGKNAPRFIPFNKNPGQTVYTPPAVDFNNLPQQTLPQVQAYARPNLPAQNTGSGYRPQFDPTFIQQMLAQRFGNQQPNAGMPAAVARPTLTPGATQTYGGMQGPSGLAGLRSIAGGMPDAPV